MAFTPSGCLTKLTICILSIGVVAAFLMTTITWRHIETTDATKIEVATLILIIMYTLIITEVIDRNLAALIGAALSIAAHDCLIGYVSMEEIVQWEDLETLALLFGMMIIVNVIGETGLFDFIAVYCYKKSAGRFWSLLTLMSFMSAILSAFIDNVSTILLMAPTIVRLGELEHIDPRYLLMIMIITSNIGGCATPVGDPPNLIVIGNPQVLSAGINFAQFVAICSPAVLICLGALVIYLKLVYKTKESFRLQETTTRREDRAIDVSNLGSSMDQLLEELRLIDMFKEHLNLLTSKMRNQNLVALLGSLDSETGRVEQAIRELTVFKESGSLSRLESRRSSRMSEEQVDQMMETCSIKNKPLLIQSSLVLLVTVLLFFVQSLPELRLTLGWISLFAALTLLVMSTALKRTGNQDQGESHCMFEIVISKVEWSTLIFFFALFIVMEVMAKLGLISFLGRQITELVELLPVGRLRLIGSISVVLWAAGLASACIDNVPFTSMMIKVIGSMALRDEATSASPGSIVPLVYALALGACLGGNGSLIGASANLVGAGISGKVGYPISFNMFFKFGAPITVLTLLLVNAYLIVVFSIVQF